MSAALWTERWFCERLTFGTAAIFQALKLRGGSCVQVARGGLRREMDRLPARPTYRRCPRQADAYMPSPLTHCLARASSSAVCSTRRAPTWRFTTTCGQWRSTVCPCRDAQPGPKPHEGLPCTWRRAGGTLALLQMGPTLRREPMRLVREGTNSIWLLP